MRLISLRPSSHRSWRRIRSLLAAVAALVLGLHDLGAQAEQVITAAAIARHVAVLAADSMQGRDTSSRLERTARYVAAQFHALGLEPVQALGLQATGDSGWIQRYPIPGHATLEPDWALLWFFSRATIGGTTVVNETGKRVIRPLRELDFRSAVVPATDTLLESRAPGYEASGQGEYGNDFTGPAPVVLAGPHTPASVRQAQRQVQLHNKVVLYIPPTGTDTAVQRQVVALLRAANHVIIVVDEDSAAFAARRRAAAAHPPVVLERYLPEARRPRRWAVYVQLATIQGELATAGFDVAAARAVTTPLVREISAVALLSLELPDARRGPTAPNAVGMLRGSTPGQVLVLTTHLDPLGPLPGSDPGDSLAAPGANNHAANSANTNANANANAADNAAANDRVWGVAGLLALAQAFKDQGTPPHRSIVFAALSGDAQGRWGSHALTTKWVSQDRIVLNIDLDMIGRVPGDSLRIAGLPDVELPVPPAWLAAQRPELGLTVVDEGGSAAAVPAHTAAADYLAFVQHMVPSLYVHGAEHVTAPGTAAPGAAPQVARVLRFVFALTQALADAPHAPRWTTEGHRRWAQLFGR